MARSWLSRLPRFAAAAAPAPQSGLIVDGQRVTSIAQLSSLLGLRGGSVTRDEALGVPTVKAARDRLVAAVTGMTLKCYRGDKEMPLAFLAQINPARINAAMLRDTVDSLFFHGIAYWHVTAKDADNYPLAAEFAAQDRVRAEGGKWLLDGDGVGLNDIICFEGLAEGILVAGGGKPIRDALNLSRAASLFSASPIPMGFFTSTTPGIDPDQDVILKFLTDWEAARAAGAWGYVPSSLKLEAPGLDPEKLQLGSAREHSSLEMARQTGIDPVNLGVSTTSRTYFNASQTRQDELDFTVSLYTRPIEQRLSMRSVTRLGQEVRFNYDAFLRSDTLSRYQTYALATSGAVQWLTADEIRELEHRAPLPKNSGPAPAEPAPADAGGTAK